MSVFSARAEDLFAATVFTPVGEFSAIEGPACDRGGNVYAVNYDHNGTIGKVTPEGARSLFVELPAGSQGNGMRFGPDGALYVADGKAHKILRVDMQTKDVTTYAQPSFYGPNDIAIKTDGTIFASDPRRTPLDGRVWRIDTDGAATILDTISAFTNGIEVSPDEKMLYVNLALVETGPWQIEILAYDLSPEGNVSNRRSLIQFPDRGLDGMRCDIAGNLYVTRYYKSRVLKISPKGEILKEIVLTGENPSNLAFGGPDGRTVYVTVADQGNIEVFRTDLAGRSWLIHQAARADVASALWNPYGLPSRSHD
ncbi:SMP-30/gluconolactonase/LRE family protein [bacterium]|nr:SMP-30/gluconolactonase/LRE family protein [bacterium]